MRVGDTTVVNRTRFVPDSGDGRYEMLVSVNGGAPIWREAEWAERPNNRRFDECAFLRPVLTEDEMLRESIDGHMSIVRVKP